MHDVFTYRSRVWFDELDAMRILHNSRYALHVERAMTAYFDSIGLPFAERVEANPDQFHAVRDYHIEFVSPFGGPGDLLVEIWREELGMTSATFGFRMVHGSAQRVVAQGRRTIVKLDPRTFAPLPWTDEFLDRTSALQVRTARRDAQAEPVEAGRAA